MIEQRHKVLYFLLISITFWLLSGYCSENSSGDNESTQNSGEPNRRISFAGYPVILYMPETSLIFGGGAAMTIRDQHNHKNYRPDNVNFYAIYTLKNQLAVSFSPDFYFDEDKWQLKMMSGYQKFPDLFYGIGNKTEGDDAENVTTEDVFVRPGLTRRIYKNLRLGVIYHSITPASKKLKKMGY